MSITRTLTAALAIMALAAPAAQAKPADMHASVAIAAAKEQGAKQDLRSPDTRDAAVHPGGPGQHAIDALGATAVDSATRPPLNTAAVSPASAGNAGDGGSGVDTTTIVLGIAGGLLAVCALAAVNGRRTRRTQRVRAAA